MDNLGLCIVVNVLASRYRQQIGIGTSMCVIRVFYCGIIWFDDEKFSRTLN